MLCGKGITGNLDIIILNRDKRKRLQSLGNMRFLIIHTAKPGPTRLEGRFTHMSVRGVVAGESSPTTGAKARIPRQRRAILKAFHLAGKVNIVVADDAGTASRSTVRPATGEHQRTGADQSPTRRREGSSGSTPPEVPKSVAAHAPACEYRFALGGWVKCTSLRWRRAL